jgi:hypothetical protein
VRLRRLRRDGTEDVQLFDTFDQALRWLEGELEQECHYEDIQSVTLDVISSTHVWPAEPEEGGA